MVELRYLCRRGGTRSKKELILESRDGGMNLSDLAEDVAQS